MWILISSMHHLLTCLSCYFGESVFMGLYEVGYSPFYYLLLQLLYSSLPLLTMYTLGLWIGQWNPPLVISNGPQLNTTNTCWFHPANCCWYVIQTIMVRGLEHFRTAYWQLWSYLVCDKYTAFHWRGVHTLYPVQCAPLDLSMSVAINDRMFDCWVCEQVLFHQLL